MRIFIGYRTFGTSTAACIVTLAAPLLSADIVAFAQEDTRDPESRREYTPDLRDADLPATAR